MSTPSRHEQLVIAAMQALLTADITLSGMAHGLSHRR